MQNQNHSVRTAKEILAEEQDVVIKSYHDIASGGILHT